MHYTSSLPGLVSSLGPVHTRMDGNGMKLIRNVNTLLPWDLNFVSLLLRFLIFMSKAFLYLRIRISLHTNCKKSSKMEQNVPIIYSHNSKIVPFHPFHFTAHFSEPWTLWNISYHSCARTCKKFWFSGPVMLHFILVWTEP